MLVYQLVVIYDIMTELFLFTVILPSLKNVRNYEADSDG